MGAKGTGDITDIGHLLATELADNGVVIAQMGDAVSMEVREPQVEVWGPIGYAARPAKPDPGTAAGEAVAVTGGDRNRALGYREMRCSEVYGNISDGEVCIFAAGADAKAMGKTAWKADGSITHATTDNNTHDGNSVYERTGPEGWQVQSPYGSIVLNSTGFHLVLPCGIEIHASPTSNPATPNRVTIKATQVYIDTPRCQIAPTAANGGKGLALPVVVAPVASPATGVPTPIGAGMGVILGETGCVLTVGV
jgi:hypothetical protein